jgi:MYXO-CTERM domain-containing protein
MRSLRVIGSLFAVTLVAAVAIGSEEFPDVPPPPPCAEVNTQYTGTDCVTDFDTSNLDFCFSDEVPPNSNYPSVDGNDGQVFVVRTGATRDCGTVLVKETGYYAIFDAELSESCADQKDETGYLKIHNSCNGDGWAVERNSGERYVVEDADNDGAGCTDDSQCAPDHNCRAANTHGRCCVPNDPVYMGTFLLVKGEENVICIQHWCPEWEAEQANGNDLGFVHDPNVPSNNCVSADSIHFKIAASSLVCKQEAYLQPCSGGCVNGECLEHPCFAANCPAYCVMDSNGAAQCVDDNPCADVTCEYGCLFGLCLQGPDARGEDKDGDGFGVLSDCDDDNDQVFPGQDEICDNAIDDDCDGFADNCNGTNFGGGGTAPSDPPANTPANGDDGGCGCRLVGSHDRSDGWVGLLLGLAALVRRRRRFA